MQLHISLLLVTQDCFTSLGLAQWIHEATAMLSTETLHLFLTTEDDRFTSVLRVVRGLYGEQSFARWTLTPGVHVSSFRHSFL